MAIHLDLRTYWNKTRDAAVRLWQRVDAFCTPVYERVVVWCTPVCRRIAEWCKFVWAYIVKWYNLITAKYLAQQEVIKKRSEVSHERLTVKRAVLLFMETWGLGSRNIFLTMWHLLWRPGHMINDYINGRRSRYMQPFFMFFVLTLILVQTAWIMDVQLPKNRDMTVTAFQLLRDYGTWFNADQKDTILNVAQWLDKLHGWRDDNRAWDLLIHSIGIVFITWLLWRKSPRVGSSEWVVDSGEIIDGYNFAEIFTVIAFILCQIQILSFIAMLLFGKLPFDHLQGFMVIPELVLTVVLLIDFKQLFQREWWSTIWRTIVIVLFI